MPVNEAKLYIAAPIVPTDMVIDRSLNLFYQPQVERLPRATQISGISGEGYLGGVVRVTQDEVIADSPAVLSELEGGNLVSPVLGSWITSAPSLGRILRRPARDGSYTTGLVVRDKAGGDFFAYQLRGKVGRKALQGIAISLITEFDYSPLTLIFADKNGEVGVNWDGEVSVTSNNPPALETAEAIERYWNVRDRFSIRWLKAESDSLQNAGFGQELVDLYMGQTWSRLGGPNKTARSMTAT